METQRMRLRCLNSCDLNAVAELLAHPEVMKFSLNGPMEREKAREYLSDRIIAHYCKWGFGPWGVFSKNGGGFMGMAGLLVQKIDGQEGVEIAYRLLPRYWNQGYATEAATAVRDWGWKHLHLTHLDSIIEPANTASVRVAEKIGMSKIKETRFHNIPVAIYRVVAVK